MRWAPSIWTRAPRDPRPWDCAATNYTEHDDGLGQRYFGRVWLNPPFDRYIVGKWILRLAQHGCGTALLHARTEAGWFDSVWRYASRILFMANRIHFHRPDGSRHSANSGAPPVLVAFGEQDLARLRTGGIPGVLVTEWEPLNDGNLILRRPLTTAGEVNEEISL